VRGFNRSDGVDDMRHAERRQVGTRSRRLPLNGSPKVKEATIPRATPSKIDKIEYPQSHYATPDQLIDDRDLSVEEKINALKVWEQDARQMLTASGEGMPGSDERIDPSNHHMLGQVERAKNRLQRKLQNAVAFRKVRM
jgi:hypothetical protein